MSFASWIVERTGSEASFRLRLSSFLYSRASGDRHRFSRGFRERRRGYEVQVSGLPNGASWQDLKGNRLLIVLGSFYLPLAHCQGTGEILFADVDHRGDGFVEYAYYDDAKNCVKKLDDTKITSHSVRIFDVFRQSPFRFREIRLTSEWSSVMMIAIGVETSLRVVHVLQSSALDLAGNQGPFNSVNAYSLILF